MINIKDKKQKTLINPWKHFGEKRMKLMESSWPELFKKEILHELPVEELSRAFKYGWGRPTKELHSVLGIVILQEMFDLTDVQAIRALAFDSQWHYALDIVNESDDEKYISCKTLWNVRRLIIEKKIDQLIFNRIAKKLAEVFSVDTNKQRLDSIHIKSNMRKLGRIGIFSQTIRKFIINLKRTNSDLYSNVDNEIISRYFSEKAMKCFSMIKPSESKKTLKILSTDLYTLVAQFKSNENIANMTTYKQMQRVLEEHCTLLESDTEVEVKKSKDVPSDSLQNPSDPDATYSGHKGQGYAAQVMETYTTTEDKESSYSFNLITHISINQAHIGDSSATIPAILSAKSNGFDPVSVASDTLYGSDYNFQEANEMGVRLISPVSGSYKTDGFTLADFNPANDRATEQPQTSDRIDNEDPILEETESQSEDNNDNLDQQEYKSPPEDSITNTKIKDDINKEDNYTPEEFIKISTNNGLICPMGHESTRSKKTSKGYIFYFDKSKCNQCPNIDKCPIKPGKNNNVLRFSEKELRLSIRRKLCEDEKFLEEYVYRAGVEATMSEFDRKTGVKHLRIRGLNRVKFCVILKATGINIFRAAKAANRRRKLGLDSNSSFSGTYFKNYGVIFSKYFKIFSSSIKNTINFPTDVNYGLMQVA